jgi:glycerol-3-phosphate O-acyltransferase
MRTLLSSDAMVALPDDRRAVCDGLLASTRFGTGLAELASQLGQDEAEVRADAARYAEEMVTGWSRTLVNLGVRLGRVNFKRGYDPQIDVDPSQVARVREMTAGRPVVFLPSHKSNLDSLVMNVALHDNELPRTCVFGGTNMSFWPIGPIFQRSGTVFIRRSSRDNPVYSFTLREYVGYLVEHGAGLQFYVEGGRSRTGKLLPPKLGLLTYVADACREGRTDDVVLVPVSIAYDQLQEVGEYAREARGDSKSAESVRWLVKAFQEQRGRFGKIYVRFAEPISLQAALEASDDDERLALQKVGIEVSRRINEVTPVTATSLVTLTLLGALGRALTLDQVRAAVFDVWADVLARRLPLADHVELGTPEGARAVLAELERHDVVVRHDDGPEMVYLVGEDQHLAAAFYRNTVIHFFLAGAMAQAALARVVIDPGDDPLTTFWETVLSLRDLLKFDFFFEPREEFRASISAELERHDPDWSSAVARGRASTETLLGAIRPLTAHTVLRSFLEAYLIVASVLIGLDGTDISDVEVLRRSQGLGRQYLLQRRIHSPESRASPLFRNAIQLARSRGLVGGPGKNTERRGFLESVRAALHDLDLVELLATARVQALIDADPSLS